MRTTAVVSSPSAHVLQVPAAMPCVAAPTYYNPTTRTRRGRVDDLIQSVQTQGNFDVRPVHVINHPSFP